MNKDIIALVSLGKIQTNRLTKDIIWNSLFFSDFDNRYGINCKVVSDFADGYLEWLSDEFSTEINPNDFETLWAVFDRYVRNNKSGYSFYDYTHFVVCID